MTDGRRCLIDVFAATKSANPLFSITPHPSNHNSSSQLHLLINTIPKTRKPKQQNLIPPFAHFDIAALSRVIIPLTYKVSSRNIYRIQTTKKQWRTNTPRFLPNHHLGFSPSCSVSHRLLLRTISLTSPAEYPLLHGYELIARSL